MMQATFTREMSSDQVSFDEYWALQKALKNAEAKVGRGAGVGPHRRRGARLGVW
jgi:hypothetical protein